MRRRRLAPPSRLPEVLLGRPAALPRRGVRGARVAVTVVDGTPDRLPYARTTSLARRRLPELWCSALGSAQTATDVLTEVGRGALLGGYDLTRPGRLDVGWTVPFRLRPVQAGLVQVLWPDTRGRFPDQPGYDHAGHPQELLQPERA